MEGLESLRDWYWIKGITPSRATKPNKSRVRQIAHPVPLKASGAIGKGET